MCACAFVRARECVCDFSFLFFYGHFGPKHLWTTGDNLNASYITRIIIHPSTIIFFIDKEDLPRGRCGGGYEPGGGVLPYMGYIGMCRGIGYGF